MPGRPNKFGELLMSLLEVTDVQAPDGPRVREPPSSVASSPPPLAKSAALAATSGSKRRAVPHSD